MFLKKIKNSCLHILRQNIPNGETLLNRAERKTGGRKQQQGSESNKNNRETKATTGKRK
jgi:hypothetical protein